jgi:unsaturated rhamnogalacturonyl hydrolase
MKETFGGWHNRIADGLMRIYPLLDAHWSYDYGVVWKGMEALFAATGNPAYFDYIKRGVDSFLNADGSVIRDYDRGEYNLDYINNGKTLLYLWHRTGELKYRKSDDK